MKVIYVDDEQPALDNFRLTIANIADVQEAVLFKDGNEALEYVKNNRIDAAFLDMEMPGIHGLALALKIKEINENIRIIFVTAYSQYAMDAWKIDANGYILKPYSVKDIKNELKKCLYRPLPTKKIVIGTIPSLSVKVDEKIVYISAAKPRELLALLIDRYDRGITTAEGIACLWPDKRNDASAQSLFRMTYKRLYEALEAYDIGYIIASTDNRRYIKIEEVDCDLFRIMSGDEQEALKYAGSYLEEYDWSEVRNGQLYQMLLNK